MPKRLPRRVGLLGTEVPGVIKRITTEQLISLGSRARQHGFSAIGRPTWTAEQRDNIRAVVLMPIGQKWRKDRQGLRCYAGVVADKIGLVVFTIDVEVEEFKDLVDVTEAWELAELLLYLAPHLPVDSEWLDD